MLFVSRLARSVCFADSCSPSGTGVPPPPAGGVVPKGGALGKEILLFGDCQGLSYKERWHCASNDGEVGQEEFTLIFQNLELTTKWPYVKINTILEG